MHQDLKSILFSEADLQERIVQMGEQISADYAGEFLVFLCVLRGAAIFAADLARAISLPMEMDFVVISSYGNAASSSGELKLQKDLSCNVEGRHVLVVEDILDSGLTLSWLSSVLEERGAASVATAVLLRKERPDQIALNCRYEGFACPDEFIVGYGLDYAQRYRNLPYIGALKPEIYS